jgi:DNA-binding helix-hairpin-helix protein with protein kinase domain
LLRGGLIWLVVSALAFWALYWVVALGITIMGAIVVLVAVLSADWDQHSTFDQREAERARRRKQKYERNAGKRAKDRARYEAGLARQAEKARRSG